MGQKKIHRWQEKHMKKCSIVLLIWEIQIKCIVRYYYPLTRMAKNFKTDRPGSDPDDVIERLKHSDMAGGNANWIAAPGNSLAF